MCRIRDDAGRTPPDGNPLSVRGRLSPRAVALTLGVLACGHALWSAGREGWTYDEAFHLQWSERFLDTGVTERSSQERLNSKTPIMVPAVLARKLARTAGVTDAAGLRLFARAPSALWLAGLFALVALAGRRVSPAAGWLALAAAALDPSLVAHGSLATADVPFAFAMLATLLAALRLWERPSAAGALQFGAALGLAFVAKVSAFLVLPGLAVLPLIAPRGEGAAHGRRRMALFVVLAGFVAWAVVCGAYLFKDVGRPLSSMALRSDAFNRLAGARPGLRLPLPEAFVTVFDASFASERGEWNVVLLGARHPHGVWYYFLVLWMLKTPLLLLAAELWGLWRAVRERAVRRDPLVRLLAWNLGLTLVYFSLAFHAQIGYRYVLVSIPLAYVIASAGLATLPGGRRWTVLAAIVVVAAVAENVAYLGNPLSFTNVAVQPKRLAYRLLADSNIDWGQNRERLRELLAARDWNVVRVDPVHILPGRNVIDLNALAGVGDFEQHAWVREHLSPGGHLGHTWLWYDVDPDTFNRFLYDARRRVSGPMDEALCPPSLDYALRPSDTETPFALRRAPQPDETWIACVVARRDTDLGLRVSDGAIAAGSFAAPGTCRTDLVNEGQEIWWRLEPGTHALCLVAQPNRRASLPFNLESQWLVRGWGVRLHVRPFTPGPTPPPPEGTIPRSSSPPRPPGG